MNPMIRAMIGGVCRILIPFAAAKGIDLDNAKLESAIEGGVLALMCAFSIYQKWKVSARIEKAKATGL
jgi:hypothetical protein